jgi:hypothetical protein
MVQGENRASGNVKAIGGYSGYSAVATKKAISISICSVVVTVHIGKVERSGKTQQDAGLTHVPVLEK